MSLAGILHTVAADPRLSRALDVARAGTARPEAADLRADGRRPRRAGCPAARAHRGAGHRAGPVRAGGHRHRPRGRGPDRRAGLVPAHEPGGLLPGLGDAAARAAVAALRHGRASGWPCCAGWPTRTRRTRSPGRCRSSSRRSAACCSRSSAASGDLEPVRLRAGDTCDPDELLTRLVEIGYAREDLVGKRGDVAVRGGIIDVFPPTEEHPVRVEFFGDTVEEIRYFKVADQRSLAEARHGLWAPPCRELLLTPGGPGPGQGPGRASIPGLSEVLGKLADGIAVEGMEAFAPVLAERMDLLTDYVPAGGVLVACDPERIRTRAEELVSTSREFLDASWVNAAAGGEAPIDLGAAAFQPIAKIREAARRPGAAVVDDRAVRRHRRRRRRPTATAAGRLVQPGGHPGRGLSRCDRRHDLGHAGLAGRRLAGRAGHRGPRPGAAARRGAPGRGPRRPDRRTCPSSPEPARALRHDRPAGARVHLAVGQAGGADRERPGRAAGQPGQHQGHAPDAEPAARRRRPAAAQPGRLRGARAARRGPVRGDDQPDRGRAPPASTWSSSTRRASAASRRTGCTCPPTSWTRSPSTPAARRPACTGWAARTGPRPRAGPARRCAEIAAELIRLYSARMASPGHAFGAGHAVAARAGGRVPLRRDPRPAGRHRRGQERHGEADPDGPADLRRRRLRQDRDRGAGGVQGGPGRHAGRGAGADHAAGRSSTSPRSASATRRSR